MINNKYTPSSHSNSKNSDNKIYSIGDYNWLPKLAFALFIILFLWSMADRYEAKKAEQFGLADKKIVSLEWQYQEKDYSFDLTLKQSVLDYYSLITIAIDDVRESYSSEKKEEIYESYMQIYLEDKTFSVIANKIRLLGEHRKLNNDELAELVLAFVQSIPHDHDFEKRIFDKEEGSGLRFPYESLYYGSGVCGDKTFLAVMILRELGYGTAIFDYRDDNHMSAAIKCPLEQSNYNSGYCSFEVSSSGIAIGETLGYYYEKEGYIDDDIPITIDNFKEKFEYKKLGKGSVLNKNEGKSYFNKAKINFDIN